MDGASLNAIKSGRVGWFLAFCIIFRHYHKYMKLLVLIRQHRSIGQRTDIGHEGQCVYRFN